MVIINNNRKNAAIRARCCMVLPGIHVPEVASKKRAVKNRLTMPTATMIAEQLCRAVKTTTTVSSARWRFRRKQVLSKALCNIKEASFRKCQDSNSLKGRRKRASACTTQATLKAKRRLCVFHGCVFSSRTSVQHATSWM